MARNLPRGFLFFCVFTGSVFGFTVFVLIPAVQQMDVQRAAFPRRSRVIAQASGESGSSAEADSRKYDGQSGEASLESYQSGSDFTAIDQELEQLLQDTSKHVISRHVIKEKLDGMLGSSADPEEGSSEVKRNYDELSCTPQQNILFLKTHKTGSSTLTNILNRYADLRELTVAIPSPGLFRFHWPAPFHWGSVDRLLLNGQLANVLSNHARYNRPSMDLIMEDNTKYITILRNPVDHFESTFNYMEFYSYFQLPKHPQSLEKFLSQPSAYLYDLMRRVEDFPEPLHLVRNGMFFDLGLHTAYHDNGTAVREAIKKIEKDFSLVLMTDFFDESLVLLKREFCWDLDDILYIKLNQRQSSDKTSKKYKSNLEEAIRRWNWADVLLYEHFHKMFWDKVESHGEAFKKDLKDFRKKNHDMYRECIASENVTETAFGTTGKIQGFKLNQNVSKYNRYVCEKMLTNEIDYIKYFRLKFHPQYGYRQQLVREGLVRPNTTDKLRDRFDALDKAVQARAQGQQLPVPMLFEPD